MKEEKSTSFSFSTVECMYASGRTKISRKNAKERIEHWTIIAQYFFSGQASLKFQRLVA